MKNALKLTLALLPLAILGAALPMTASAQSVVPAPALLNFQGRLAIPSGSPVPDGTYSLRFSLWNVASGGTAAANEKWTQTISTVAVKNGVFAVVFDTTTNAVLFNSNLWLEIKIGANTPLAPRQQLLTVAQALKANTVPDFSITSSKIQNGAITADKLASNVFGGNAGGDLMGTYPNPTLRTDPLLLTKVSGTFLNILNGIDAVDQNQSLTPSIITDYAWQSFKPTAGRLTGLDIYVGTSTGSTHVGNLVIRQGVGNDKPEVARVQVTVQPAIGWQHFDLANGGIDVTNTDYTWDMGSFAPLRFGYSTGNPYPNGIADIGDTLDFGFRTYLRNGTNPVISAFAPFNFTNTTQIAERFRLSGQEFYQASNTSTDGISFLLGTNRTSGRQLWLGDSARLGVDSTNPLIRFGFGTAGNTFIDSVSTNLTPQNLTLNPLGGNVGIGTAPNTSRLAVNGVIESKTGGVKFPDGSIQLTASNVWISNGNNIYNSNSGNVGIGTSTPGFPLTFANTTGNKISLYGQSGNNYGFGIQGGLLQIYSDASGADIAFGYGSSAAFTERMRVKGDGRVGIGTSSPTANTKLEVNSGGGTNTSLKLEHTGSNLVVRPLSSGGSATVVENSAGNLLLNMSGGNVGVGVNPGANAKLHVRGRAYVEGTSNWGGDPTVTLAIGDTDTGLNWGGDGNLQLVTDGVSRAQLSGSTFNVDANFYADYIQSNGSIYSAGYFTANSSGSLTGNFNYQGGDGNCIVATNASTSGNWPTIYSQNNGNSSRPYTFYSPNGILSSPDKRFIIDHPLDPANKTLEHACVESDERRCMYTGTVLLDGEGEAWVPLPSYCQALNKDFTYQLTAIGGPGRDLYIAQEIKDNRFQIAGGRGGMKVSWTVTGVRQDAWAKAYPFKTEQDKGVDRGRYLTPRLFGQPDSKGGVMQPPVQTKTH